MSDEGDEAEQAALYDARAEVSELRDRATEWGFAPKDKPGIALAHCALAIAEQLARIATALEQRQGGQLGGQLGAMFSALVNSGKTVTLHTGPPDADEKA